MLGRSLSVVDPEAADGDDAGWRGGRMDEVGDGLTARERGRLLGANRRRFISAKNNQAYETPKTRTRAHSID